MQWLNANQGGISRQQLKIQDLESNCSSPGNALLLNGCQKQNISELAPLTWGKKNDSYLSEHI